MKTADFWLEQENELKLLLEQREILSQKIHLLKVALRQHKNGQKKENAGQNSLCYKHYGKRYKELNEEEKREWAKIRKAKSRERKKEIEK